MSEVSDEEFERVYGPWAGRTPAEAAELFAGYSGTWWIAGGWAIEAFTGVAREHHDVDPSVLLEGSGQVWLRPAWDRPWEYDVLLAPGDATTWVYKRDPSISMSMVQAIWTRAGVNYLQPEIQLLYKARDLRPQDQTDFDAALPLLDRRRRDWLRDSLRQTLPDHPWLVALR